MKHLGLNDDDRKALVRALVSVATNYGVHPLTKLDASMIGGLQLHLLHTDFPLEDLSHITPAEFARQIANHHKAETALQFIAILSYTDTSLDTEKLLLIDAFADALKVSTDTLKLIHQARDHQVLAMEHCIYRKIAKDQLAATDAQSGFKALRDAIGKRSFDMEVASRYQRLGLLPENTLGRSIWEFYRLRNFAFPGEGTIDETASFLLVHDTCHILGGFNTTVEGEVTVGGFQAGMTKKHPWMFAVVGVLDFHMGIDAYTGPLKPRTGNLDPEKFTAAFERGLAMNVDIQKEWNLWERMDQDLDDLRREANIIGAENVHRHLPEGWWSIPREGWWPTVSKIAD